MNSTIGIFTVILLTGCASTAEYLRSQPAAYFPADVAQPGGKLKDIIALHCMKEQDVPIEAKGGKYKECLYVSADASKLIELDSDNSLDNDTRDMAITYLVGVSDMNCSNFMHRAFANKAGLDFTKRLTGDLATGASAGTAFTSPAASAALSVSNLIIGKSIESFNSNYFFDKTFQALESAIYAQRLDISSLILAKRSQARGNKQTYNIVQALSDIRAYDDACSIKAGLARLVQLADKEKDTSEKLNKADQIDPQKAVERLARDASESAADPRATGGQVRPSATSPSPQ